jgi:Protein of unknown function (DUF559)
VYIDAAAPLDHSIWREAALLLAPPGTVLGYRSALGLYCPALEPNASAPVDVIVPRTTSLKVQRRLRIHRTTLTSADVRSWLGLPVTTSARTGFDLARGTDLVDAVICVDALLDRRVTTKEEISRYLPLSLPGTRGAARVLALSSPGAESPMETRTRLMLVFAGLPTPTVQHEVWSNREFVARLDLAYPALRLGIEYDGDQHRQRETFQADAVRANRLRLCGWTVLRFTANDVLRHPDRAVHQVAALLTASHSADRTAGWPVPVDVGRRPAQAIREGSRGYG